MYLNLKVHGGILKYAYLKAASNSTKETKSWFALKIDINQRI